MFVGYLVIDDVFSLNLRLFKKENFLKYGECSFCRVFGNEWSFKVKLKIK